MKKGKIAAIVSIIAVIAVIVVVALRIFKPAEIEAEIILPVVEVTQPAIGSIELYRELTGTVEPSDVVYIYPKMAGEVKQVNVKVGDIVSEGQILCEIDTKMVESARLTLESAQISLSDANTNLQRMEVLYAAGDISTQTIEQYRSSVKAAQIQYDTAKLNYDTQLEYSSITAPISGKVESCDMEVFDTVSQTKLICVISGEGSKAISFAVPEKISEKMQVGDEIEIEKNGSIYQGVITEVNTMLDSTTGLFKIKASVEHGDALATGTSVKLKVISDYVYDVMTLPVDAIYYSGGDAYVYTYDDGTVHRVPLEVGIYDSVTAQIISGVSMSDQVITTWSSELFEGSQVQLSATETAEAKAE